MRLWSFIISESWWYLRMLRYFWISYSRILNIYIYTCVNYHTENSRSEKTLQRQLLYWFCDCATDKHLGQKNQVARRREGKKLCSLGCETIFWWCVAVGLDIHQFVVWFSDEINVNCDILVEITLYCNGLWLFVITLLANLELVLSFCEF